MPANSIWISKCASHYQRVMTKILGKFIVKFVMVFYDDVIVYSKTAAEHFNHLRKVLKPYRKIGSLFKRADAHFFNMKCFCSDMLLVPLD